MRERVHVGMGCVFTYVPTRAFLSTPVLYSEEFCSAAACESRQTQISELYFQLSLIVLPLISLNNITTAAAIEVLSYTT